MNVGVFFPSLSFKIINKDLIQVGIDNLKNLGCNVILAENCFESFYTSKIAGELDRRVKILENMLNDDNIDIIMAGIGGYGSIQLLDKINFSSIKKSKKIIGFSDVTHLLIPLFNTKKLDVYLGPAFINFCNPYVDNKTIECFKSIVLDECNEYKYEQPKYFCEDDWFIDTSKKLEEKVCKSYSFIKPGIVRGKCIGGNLPSMLDLFGTKFYPRVNKKTILFIEVVSADSVEVIMDQFYKLKLTGVLNKIGALVIGKISGQNIFANEEIFVKFLKELLKEYNNPVIIGTMFTHLDPLFTLQFGSTLEINSQEKIIKMIKRRKKIEKK